MMKRFFSVIALSVALGLSAMGFTNGDRKASAECEEANDLTVTAALEEMGEGSTEIKGMIVNSSSDNEYDDVVVRVDFYGDASTSDMSSSEMDDPAIDTDRDVDMDVSDGEVEMEYDTEAELESDLESAEMESDMKTHDDSSLGLTENSLGSRVITVNEDVEAGEVEEFALDLTPPAGTTRIVTSVVCAD